MIFERHTPRHPLNLFIKHIIYAKGAQPLPYLMELPEGRINLVIELVENSPNTVYTERNLQGKNTMKKGWLSGLSGQAIVYQSNNNSAILSIRFTASGFFALTKIPADKIMHPCVEAEQVLGNSFARLYEKLLNAENIPRLFQLVEDHFLGQLSNETRENSLIQFIEKNIEKPLEWLIAKTSHSQKHVIHLTKKYTGFSPKYLQRLSRFQSALREIQAATGKVNWSPLVFKNGYFDQAHFIKEFGHFTGMNPTRYSAITQGSDHNKIFSDVVLLPGIL